MNIKKNINLLIKKYNLQSLYNKYILVSILYTIIKESFHWFLLYFSIIVKKYTNLIYQFVSILIFLLILNIPMEKYFNSTKNILIKEIKIANYKFFTDRLTKIDKNELLNFNLVEFYNIIEHFNENLEQYISNLKIKYDIPLRFISLLIFSINNNFIILIILFIVFYIIVKLLNEKKLLDEQILTHQYFTYDNIIRNYIVNSKNYLINNEINSEYLLNNIFKFEETYNNIEELNNKLDFKVNIWMFIYILIIMKIKLSTLNELDFYLYFITVYDIEHIADKIILYYKNKYIISKMQKRLDYLYQFIPSNTSSIYNLNDYKIHKIIINEFYNNNPKLINSNKIIINENDHILVSGKSGSGKTSLLYLLKGVIKINDLNIHPNINIINNQSYLTLSNHKSIYSGKLYDIITNYNSDPNISLINYSLENAKIDRKLNNNEFINIEKLSSGERIRVLVARLIYIIKNANKYNILLFDEIDENLNDDLAIEIYKSIDRVFNDKIILYITHNEKVKQLFNKQIIIENGNILIN